MANLTTTYDIVSSVLNSCGELTTRGGTSDYEAVALQYVNRMQRAVMSGSSEWGLQLAEPFVWAKSQWPGIFQLQTTYSTGGVTLTNNSTAGVFDTPPSFSAANWYLKVTGRAEFFRITAHTASSANFTIDTTYTEESGSALGFTINKIDYDLASGILRLISPMKVYKIQTVEADDRGVIEGIDLKTLNQDYPLHRLVNGVPTKFAVSYKTTGSTVTIRVNRVVTDKPVKVEYDYIPVPTDLTDDPSSIPLVPIEHREVLWYGASYYLMLDKSDNRATEMKNNAAIAVKALIEANKKERLNISRMNLGRLIPRRDLQSENVRRYVTQEILS